MNANSMPLATSITGNALAPLALEETTVRNRCVGLWRTARIDCHGPLITATVIVKRDGKESTATSARQTKPVMH